MDGMKDISVSELAPLCREETERFRRNRDGKQGYCFEVARRAIVDRDQEAWHAFYNQYWRLVAKWVNGPAEDKENRVQEVFIKFLGPRVATPEAFGAKFSTIGQVIGYLHTTALNFRIDADRRGHKERQIQGLMANWPQERIRQDVSPIGQAVMMRELLEHISRQAQDEKERVVLDLSFRVGLGPKQIAKERPDLFADVEEVRRTKERVVYRLSRDSRLQSWWKGPKDLGKDE